MAFDEQTGIQALELVSPYHSVPPGMTALREYEHTRHGTLCLFGNLHEATVELLLPNTTLAHPYKCTYTGKVLAANYSDVRLNNETVLFRGNSVPQH